MQSFLTLDSQFKNILFYFPELFEKINQSKSIKILSIQRFLRSTGTR